MKLLENTGICVVPGGGFIVDEGDASPRKWRGDGGDQFYFRTTILPGK
jgi:hypothetical protein